MHDGEPYGHLTIEGEVLDDAEVARLVHMGYQDYKAGLTELVEKKVLKFTKDEIPYSSRMVKDEQFREVRRAAGKLGGNPALLNQDLKVEDKVAPKVKTTPSSSSSSSLSSSSSKKKEQVLKEPDSIESKEPKDEEQKTEELPAWQVAAKRLGAKERTENG